MGSILRRAYQATEPKTAQRLLGDLAKRLIRRTRLVKRNAKRWRGGMLTC